MKTADTLSRINQERSTIMEHATQQKHTPTPWDVVTSNGIPYITSRHRSIELASLCQLEDGINNEAKGKERIANAAFIVTACNSHAALVEALERCLPIIGAYLQDEHKENHTGGVESYAECTHSPCVLIRSIRDNARAALTLAKGGK